MLSCFPAFLLIGCDFITGEEKNVHSNNYVQELNEYNIIEIDTAYVYSLLENADENQLNFNRQLDTQDSNNEDTYKLIDTTFAVNVFLSRDDFVAAVQTLELESKLYNKKITIHKRHKKAIENLPLFITEFHFINHQGRIVIEDSLYTVNPSGITARYIGKDTEKDSGFVGTSSFGDDCDPATAIIPCGEDGGGDGDGTTAYTTWYFPNENGIIMYPPYNPSSWDDRDPFYGRLKISVIGGTYFGIPRVYAENNFQYRLTSNGSWSTTPTSLDVLISKVEIELNLRQFGGNCPRVVRTEERNGNHISISRYRCNNTGYKSFHTALTANNSFFTNNFELPHYE